jgi:hypothetical protein
MKKTLVFTMLLWVQLTTLQGVAVIGRAACEFPQMDTFRSVYGNSGIVNGELEASIPLQDFLSPDSDLFKWSELPLWSCWGNLSYFTKCGQFTYLKETTQVTNWSLNFGLKRYFYDECDIRPYYGFGIGAAHARFEEHSIYVREEINMWGFAFLAKLGVEYEFYPSVFLDLFIDYSYNGFGRLRSKHGVGTRNTNTGGIKAGAGLGWRFPLEI